MKGYVKPEGFKEGVCFICGEPCKPEHYCHFECALAYSEAKDRKIKKAHAKAIQQEMDTRGGKENGVG